MTHAFSAPGPTHREWELDEQLIAAVDGRSPRSHRQHRRAIVVAAVVGTAGAAVTLTPLVGVGSVLLASGGLWLLLLTRGHRGRAARLRRALEAAGPDLCETTALLLAAGTELAGALGRAATFEAEAVQRFLAASLHAGSAQPVTVRLRAAGVATGVELPLRLSAQLDRAERFGTAAVPTLHALAEALRAEHAAAANERAGRAAPIAAAVTATVVAPACIAMLGSVLVAGLGVH